MNSILIGTVVFVCVFGGALLGLFLRTVLPGHHLAGDAKEAVKLGAGLVATLTALVLGLLISSSKATFDDTNSMLMQAGAKILVLDRIMASYGPESKPVRDRLRDFLQASLEEVWPEDAAKFPKRATVQKMAEVDPIQSAVRALVPQSDLQRSLQTQAVQISGDLSELRWTLFEQLRTSLPAPLLFVIIFWATILFACFGLVAPRNGTVIVVFLVCAISVAGAVFLVLEMGKPLSGVMKISSAPLIQTIERLGK